MSKFKVGDRVKVVLCGWGIGDSFLGKTLTITGITDNGRYLTNRPDHPTHSAHGKSYELAWQPNPGDKISCSDTADFDRDSHEEFVIFAHGKFVTHDGSIFDAWKYARPIKTTVTIIKESTGEKVEISQESSTSIFG